MNTNEEMVRFRPSRRHTDVVQNCPQPESEAKPLEYAPPPWSRITSEANMRDALHRIIMMDDVEAIHEMVQRVLAYDRCESQG